MVRVSTFVRFSHKNYEPFVMHIGPQTYLSHAASISVLIRRSCCFQLISLHYLHDLNMFPNLFCSSLCTDLLAGFCSAPERSFREVMLSHILTRATEYQMCNRPTSVTQSEVTDVNDIATIASDVEHAVTASAVFLVSTTLSQKSKDFY